MGHSEMKLKVFTSHYPHSQLFTNQTKWAVIWNVFVSEAPTFHFVFLFAKDSQLVSEQLQLEIVSSVTDCKALA